MSKLNLAVLIGGEWRTGFDAYPYISYYLEKSEKFNVDYFIYTYIENNFRTFRPEKLIPSKLTDRYIKNIEILYQPKKIQIDTNNCDMQKYNSPPFYTFKKCNDLKNEYKKETGIKYDYVLKIRPDLFLWNTSETSLETEINLLQNHTSNYFINFFNFETDYLNLTENLTLHDIYHLGNEELMDSYANINIKKSNSGGGVYQYKWAKDNNYIPIGRNWGLHLVRYFPNEMDMYPSDFNDIMNTKEKLFSLKNPKNVLLNDKRIPMQIKKWFCDGFTYYILPPLGHPDYN